MEVLGPRSLYKGYVGIYRNVTPIMKNQVGKAMEYKFKLGLCWGS